MYEREFDMRVTGVKKTLFFHPKKKWPHLNWGFGVLICTIFILVEKTSSIK